METEIPRKTENQGKRRRRTKFTPSVIFNIALIFGVFMIIALVLYAPKADFYKGALISRPQTGIIGQIEAPKNDQMQGALLIDYITKKNDISLDGKLATLTSFVLEAKYEEMGISSFLFEFEGNMKDDSIQDVKLLVDGHEIDSNNYIWISPNRLLIEVSSDEVVIKDRLPITLQGVLNNVESGQKITVLVSDISAIGLTLNKQITNIGVKGEIDAAGTALNIK